MRVLHVIESLNFGGAEKVTVHLANRLSEIHEVNVCLVKSRGELVEELSKNIDLTCLNLGEGIHYRLPRLLAEIISRNQIEIVHVHNWAIFFECFLAVKIAGSTRLIFTVHGPYAVYGNSLVQAGKKRLRHFLERLAASSKQVCKIVTVSEAIQEYIINDIGISASGLTTIHNGIEQKNLVPVVRGSGNKLISVGRLAPVKNHTLMIDAFKLSLEKNRDLHLTIVGDGPQKAVLERYIMELGLENQVTLLGFRNDIVELLSAHDVFLVSSDYEGISIALLEAMSLALPAIATNVGGIPESVKHEKTGFIVAPGDKAGFADAILKLTASTDLARELGNNAKAFFDSNFHEDIVIEKYTNLYKDCISAFR